MKKIRSRPAAAFVMLLLFLAAFVTAAAQTQEELAVKGYAILSKDPVLAKVREDGATSGDYFLGFDIATAIFGDPALGAQGNTVVGPGALKYRNALSASGQKGFDDSVKFHLDRHYKRSPAEVSATDKKNTTEIMAAAHPSNAPDTTYEIRCRGGASRGKGTISFETVGSRVTSTGETISIIRLTSEPGPFAAGTRGEGLSPGECSWVDRPIFWDVFGINERYLVIRFETPANAQLKQVLHGTPVDNSPTAAERFPDAQTIPDYIMYDDKHYWSFFGVKRVSNFYTATGHKYWRPEPPAVKAVQRVKLPPGAQPIQPIPICDAAGQARARKSPATAGLEEQCRADLAARGRAIADQDAVVAKARTAELDALYEQGFDIATGLFGDPGLGALGHTALGPGSLGIRDSLSAAGQRGFNASVKLHLSRNYKH